MTTMPPEMSATAAAGPTVVLTSSVGLQRESSNAGLATVTRSRFMITDILAGSAAAAAAAAAASVQSRVRNDSGASPNAIQQQQRQQLIQYQQQQNQQLQHLHTQKQHHQQHVTQEQQQPAHHTALQHYLAQQQQHLLQQQQLQYRQRAAAALASPTTPPFPSLLTSMHQQYNMQGSPVIPGTQHSNATTSLQYVAQLQHERLRDLNVATATDDERSRSPLIMQPLGSVHELSTAYLNNNKPNHINNGNNTASLGCSSSISGDQASTIDDDSGSDCGAKDDDGNSSIKSSGGAGGDNNLSLGLSKKQRKARTAFTDHQLQTLEKSFERQKYLSVQDRMELANKLELSDCQVKTWYQNRRTKWKRQTAVGLELLAEAGNYAAFQRLYGASSPYLNSWPYASVAAAAAAAQLPPEIAYYRQTAAVSGLQKPIPASYRMYSGLPALGPGMPPPPASALSHLHPHSQTHPTIGSYYQAAIAATSAQHVGPGPEMTAHSVTSSAPSPSSLLLHSLNTKSTDELSNRQTPSPQLNPGSPPLRSFWFTRRRVSVTSLTEDEEAPSGEHVVSHLERCQKLSRDNDEAGDGPENLGDDEDAIEV